MRRGVGKTGRVWGGREGYGEVREGVGRIRRGIATTGRVWVRAKAFRKDFGVWGGWEGRRESGKGRLRMGKMC